MSVWYVETVWDRGTCVGFDSDVVGNCVWNFVRASNVKGFGTIGATGCAIEGVVVGAARGEFRRYSVFVWTYSISTAADGGAIG